MDSRHWVYIFDYDTPDHYPDYYCCIVLYAVDAHRRLLLAALFIDWLPRQVFGQGGSL